MNDHDSNFEEFISNWDDFCNRLVVFLGAGASIGANNAVGRPLPGAYDLRNELWTKFKLNDTTKPFDPQTLRLMTLEHAAAIIEAKSGRTLLSEYLVERFRCNPPLWQHVALPYLRPRSLFTTNYDELVEIGYKSHSDQIDIVCNNRAPMQNRVVLYKPHGSLTHANQPVGQGGLVITQFDYLEMISEYRKMLERSMTCFGGTCVLIIGYSFGDMDIGAQLYSLRKQNDGIPWYAVFPRNDPPVRRMYSKRFGIEQINSNFQQFLVDLDARVGFLPDALKHERLGDLRAAGKIQ